MTASLPERVRYFPRQIMTADDMRTEQTYFVERMRRHNRLLHGWGIACGLEVKPYATAEKPWQVVVCPGSAFAAPGDEIHVPCQLAFDLAHPPDLDGDCAPCPCPPGAPLGTSATGIKKQYLAIRYVCRPARPVRTGHANCGCGDEGCETSRWRDDFELTVLDKLEGPYAQEWTKAEDSWFGDLVGRLPTAIGMIGLPTRPCAPATDYPWIILAEIEADLSASPTVNASSPQAHLEQALTNSGAVRRPLLQVNDLLELIRRMAP